MVGDWETVNGKDKIYHSRENGSLHNNFVEKNFDITKNKILKGKRVSCSEYTRATYESIESTHIEYFPPVDKDKETDKETDKKTNKKTDKKKLKIAKRIKETWKNTKIKRRRRRSKIKSKI
jgi:hypothetical protein